MLGGRTPGFSIWAPVGSGSLLVTVYCSPASVALVLNTISEFRVSSHGPLETCSFSGAYGSGRMACPA